MSAPKMLETIDLALRVLKTAGEVELSAAELKAVRRIARAHLDAVVGLETEVPAPTEGKRG